MATGTPAVPHIINGLRVFSLIGLPFMAFFPSVRLDYSYFFYPYPDLILLS